jgi:uncharacterized protein DUF1553/uncharacterized protein DUF1549/Big-like domain-containing protein
MNRTSNRWRILIALVALTCAFGHLAAGDVHKSEPAKSSGPTPIAAADVQALSINPAKVTLRGSDDAMQIVVTATLKNGELRDVSGQVKYSAADEKLVRITTAGRVTPVADGATEITATLGDKTAKIAAAISDTTVSLPINFGNQITPIFTKLGCNGGGCHGKASGQNGFKISLLGFEPELDYQTIVKEGRGRRVFPAAPDNSLLLLKATGQLPHGGGKRLDKDSDEYRLIRRWIASGMPFGKAGDPTVAKITVFPEKRTMPRNDRQQVAVCAHYTDGRVEDITRRAQYESNETEVAVVDPSGLINTNNVAGESAVMVRYQGNVTVFRATVPLGVKIPDYQFPAKTLVDQHTLNKFKQLGLVPSELCADEEFIRRASLHICGTLPTPTEVTNFVNDKNPAKRDVLVDTLLERPEHAYFFANKWADILRVKRRQLPQRAEGTFAFHEWIRQAIAEDKPYSEFIRDIIAASGDERSHPPSVWYKELTDFPQFVDDTAQVFLGLRLACAQCHHHPYEKWSQDDYWGMAAFYGRVGRKNINEPGGFQNQPSQLTRIFVKNNGSVTNKRTGQAAKIKALETEPMDIAAGDDPRQRLVDWMTDPNNRFVARAVANRYWAHFFGRGIVDPLDDMRVTNPASNDELLDALAKDFVASNFSLKHLIRTITKSRTYQLSAIPNDYNRLDKQSFARFYPQRLGAEVLLDAVNQVTDSPTQFNGLPQDTYAPRRAIMLPDESYSNYFLEVFGKPQRTSACECERVSEANLAQALHLLNSDEVQGKLNRGGARADTLAKDPRDDRAKIEELFLWAFARKPTPPETDAAIAHINKVGTQNKKVAYENIIWALINTKEFVFND